jgi:exopolyphosphatase/guanosine-5'-triphosphate,3'-diphosphate pyrophosphatase
MKQNTCNFRHFALIDLGSAAIRFELYRLDLSETPIKLKLLEKKRTLLRLGQLKDGHIPDHKIKELLEVLKEIKSLSCHYQDLEIKFVATEALRIAENKEDIIDSCLKIIPKKIEIISPTVEARLTIEGITYFENFTFTKAFFLDIGGKSSEISLVNNNEVEWSVSIPCGALMVDNNGTYINQAIYLPLEVKQYLNKILVTESELPLIGSGGTFRAFERLISNLGIQSSESITRYMEAFCLLESCSGDEFIKLTEEQKERRDLIPQGLGILREILLKTNPSDIYVTKYSLRHGLLKSLILPYLPDLYYEGPSGLKVGLN